MRGKATTLKGMERGGSHRLPQLSKDLYCSPQVSLQLFPYSPLFADLSLQYFLYRSLNKSHYRGFSGFFFYRFLYSSLNRPLCSLLYMSYYRSLHRSLYRSLLRPLYSSLFTYLSAGFSTAFPTGFPTGFSTGFSRGLLTG